MWNTSNKFRAVVVAAVVITLCAGALVYDSWNERYYITSAGGGVSYKIDRRTGQMWQIRGTTLTAIETPGAATSSDNATELPQEVQKQIKGRGEMIGSSFFGSIYNGTPWTLTKVRVNIASKDGDAHPFSRNYLAPTATTPESTGSFQVDVGEPRETDAITWRLVTAWGVKK